MKACFFFIVLLNFSLQIAAQDIRSADPVILPEVAGGTYIKSPTETAEITSEVSITLLPGVHIQPGANVVIKIAPAPPIAQGNLDKNWVFTETFDEDGKLTSQAKSFFDFMGQPTQSQVKNLSGRTVIASELLYDSRGRAAISTLPAPINSSAFNYKELFVANSSGDRYSYKNFDLIKKNNPDQVTDEGEGTLGRYYSQNNETEPFVAPTFYPYTRTDFYSDGTGAVKRMANAGEELRLGKGREVSSIGIPVLNELNHYKQVRDKFFSASVGSLGVLSGNALQNIATDENGNRSISITDLAGRPLMQALSKEEGWLTVSNTASLNAVESLYRFSVPGVSLILGGPNNGQRSGATSCSVSSLYPIKVYKSNSLIFSGPGNEFSYSVPQATVISPGLEIQSEYMFYVNYNEIGTSGCDECPAALAEPDKSSVHYFQLLQPSAITVSGSSNYQLYDMTTEQAVPSTGILAAGQYKLIDKLGVVQLTYTNNYSDISYSFYNQQGQMVASIAPEGVKKLIENINAYATAADIPFVTLYEYDLRGILIATDNKAEGGRSEFIYRKDGKIRFSQNAEQRKAGKFSYTNYDRWARAFESGEYTPGTISFASARNNEGLLENTTADGGLTGGVKSGWAKTHYGEPNNSHGLNGYIQDESYLKAGVSWTENEYSKTWYNYDSEGRIAWIVKQVAGLGNKTIDYSYNALGSVVKVDYQKDVSAERFTHEYDYDQDGRLAVAYSSASGGARKKQAGYSYYLHGPLKRVELADKLQGIDYTYTPQGWLKTINHPDNTKDPGNDGNNGFAPDVFGMTLEYFNGDYSNYANGINSLVTGAGKAYYNGTIQAQSWRSNKSIPGTNNSGMYVYDYTDKYEFKESRFGTANYGTNTFSEVAGINKEYNLTYDANGNIRSLSRTDQNGNIKDSFTGANYHYISNSNKLGSVDNYASYQYDDLGQMTGQVRPGNQGYYLSYDVSGKVRGIYSDASKTQLRVSFAYDESGNRISKTDHLQGIVSYYVPDASGNVLAIYGNPAQGQPVVQQEIPVYASGRIGVYYRAANNYQYELTDHLGNVRAVINSTKTSSGLADVIYNSDYYPFGSRLNYAGSDNYRYGYQGQYAERDDESNWLNFALRMYDPMTGRWMTTDPYGQYYSPYVGMGNDPVNRVDPDGGFDGDPKKDAPYHGVLQEINVFATTLSKNINIDWQAIGFKWYDYLGDPYNLLKDTNESLLSLGYLLRTETYLNTAKFYSNASAREIALAEANGINALLNGSITNAPLAYLGGSLTTLKSAITVEVAAAGGSPFGLKDGYGVFGKEGLTVGNYRIDLAYANPTAGPSAGTIFSLKQQKTGGALWRLDYGKLHSTGEMGLHSTVRFHWKGIKYGNTAQRNWFPSTFKAPFFKSID